MARAERFGGQAQLSSAIPARPHGSSPTPESSRATRSAQLHGASRARSVPSSLPARPLLPFGWVRPAPPPPSPSAAGPAQPSPNWLAGRRRGSPWDAGARRLPLVWCRAAGGRGEARGARQAAPASAGRSCLKPPLLPPPPPPQARAGWGPEVGGAPPGSGCGCCRECWGGPEPCEVSVWPPGRALPPPAPCLGRGAGKLAEASVPSTGCASAGEPTASPACVCVCGGAGRRRLQCSPGSSLPAD